MFILGSFYVNFITVLCVLYLIFFNSEIFKNFNTQKNLVYFFIFVSLVNSFFSNYFEYSILKSLAYIRFFALIFVIFFILEKMRDHIKKKIYIFYFLVIIFVCFDTLIQYFYGKDIFGFARNANYFRLSGPFGDEYIVGFFILYFGGLTLSKLYFFENFKKNKFYFPIFLSLITCIVFVSGERASFLSVLIFLLFIFLFIRNIRKQIILSIFLSGIICSTFYLNDQDINDKYNFFHIQKFHLIVQEENVMAKKNKNEIKKDIDSALKIIKHNQWIAHYKGAIAIFKDNIFLGSGFKTFRFECPIMLKKRSDIFCSTHPHNIYFEVLSDLGLLGVLYLLLLLFLGIKFIIKNIKYFDEKTFILLSLLIAFVFPLKPHGSLFTTNYAFVLFFLIVNLKYLILKNKKNEK